MRGPVVLTLLALAQQPTGGTIRRRTSPWTEHHDTLLPRDATACGSQFLYTAR